MKRVLVMGGTGFVGRHAVAELLRRGHHVRALVRDRGRASLPAGVELVEGAIGNRDAIAALAAGATAP